MGFHEREFGVYRSVGGVDWTATLGWWKGRVVVCRENDEAGWRYGIIGRGLGMVDVGCCFAGGEKIDVGGWVDVGVDVDKKRRHG